MGVPHARAGGVVGALVILAALLVPATATAAPAVAFLNPSDYSPAVQVSDKTDADQQYHLSAWAGDAPNDPLIEFEIQSPGGSIITMTASRASADTWDAGWDIPSSLMDGQYTFRAILYGGFTGPGTGSEVARAEKIVAINQSDVVPPPAAETVEILYPRHAGDLGFFSPKDGSPRTVIDARASTGAQQVRVLYTTSEPGAAPAWTACGSGPVSSGFAQVACTLGDEAVPAAVTAVAAVANKTPWPGTASPVADDSGDAHRITPYLSTPSFVDVSPRSSRAELSTCKLFTAVAEDQNGRPLAGANVDVHATEPNDQLRFATSLSASDYQAPDEGHAGTEPTRRCTEADEQRSQGEHNVAGGSDFKHIETTGGGTNASGAFVFALHSADQGGTTIEAWVDENDDDTHGTREATGGAVLGWATDPPQPQLEFVLDPARDTETVGGCSSFVIAVREGGNPVVGANVDVHASGPDETVSFCSFDPSGRPPDSGDHVGHSHEGRTRHLEGETDERGRFSFGVSASTPGETDVMAWLDVNGSDTWDEFSGERSASGKVTWREAGERSISLDADRRRVRQGRRVKLFGSIDGSASCRDNQTVKVKWKRLRGGRFSTVKTTITDGNGSFEVRVRMRRAKRFKAIAPSGGICERAASNVVTVRIRR